MQHLPDNGWQVDPRPVPEGLEEGFIPTRTDWVSIQEKIGAAKREELMAIFGGYPIDPSI